MPPTTPSTNVTFEIIPKNWTKRRKAKPEPRAVAVEIPEFVYEKNHQCIMYVTYDDGSTREYLGRVLQNPITGRWAVDGMHVAVRVIT
ncbi:hypothetical protein OE749_14755 [Aestuariibacter sp. AA17]|uniref:Transposase n=1 Tax=Fluctibacter corallii TaxID=2984329 RepID=A0ABT3ABI1_9ALTE|nr:hypothetical protein [Aestuariibacter sp. AA17]MCV2885950.1 hypothetical protein [Aestuariibacter sp. AA17]